MSSSRSTDPREKIAFHLTPETALLFGKLTGSDHHAVVITTDRNPSSLMMREAVIAGIVSIGGIAYVLEDVLAPSVPHCEIPFNYHINISTKESSSLSGMEIFNQEGAYISAMDVFNMTYREMGIKYPPFNALGTVIRRGEDISDDHHETLRAKMQDCNCQVAVDGTYWLPAKMASRTLTSLNADVVFVKRFGQNYLPSMDESDLQDLSRMIDSYRNSIGIALNSDGTRVAAFDNRGRYIPSEKIAIIFAKSMNLKKVTVPINMTMAVDDAMKANDGTVIRAGHSFMSAVDTGIANDSDMIFDGEGHFVFTDTSLMSDGIHAALKLAEINGKVRLSDIVDEIPTYSTDSCSIRTPANKNELNQTLHKFIEEEGYEYIDTGSIRIAFDEGWILIHLEEYDDSVTILCEGRDRTYSVSLMEIAKNIVEECIRKCS